jgi:hypothetical protein
MSHLYEYAFGKMARRRKNLTRLDMKRNENGLDLLMG